MASNEDLAPSPLPSPPPSSLPPSTHSATPSSSPPSSSPPSRPIPIEIYNHILHFAFGRHLPPLPLANRLDEPPSLSHLLPLTLVSKGLRELVLPFLYHHLVVRQGEDWAQLLDPIEGLLVGQGEEEKKRRGWVKNLSFPRDHFPVSSWTPSKDLAGGPGPRHPDLNMAPLDFSGLGELEEVYIGDWGRDDVVQREIEAAVKVEMEGYHDQMVKRGFGFTEEELRDRERLGLRYLRSVESGSLVFNLLSQTEPSLLHLSLLEFPRQKYSPPTFKLHKLILHPHDRTDLVGFMLSTLLTLTTNRHPSSRFNVDPVLEALSEETRKSFLASISGWASNEDGWWTADASREG